MTVYIDHYPEWLGVPTKWIGGGHLFGTDLTELHAFAQAIGLRRSWYQGEQFPHYDCTKWMRQKAIHYGAIETEPGVIPENVIRHDPDSR